MPYKSRFDAIDQTNPGSVEARECYKKGKNDLGNMLTPLVAYFNFMLYFSISFSSPCIKYAK